MFLICSVSVTNLAKFVSFIVLMIRLYMVS